jgi:hypothetical protein
MTDLEGWQRPMGEEVSGPERSEERQRSLAASNGRAQAMTGAVADASRSASLASPWSNARCGVRGNPKRDRLPLSRRRSTVSTTSGSEALEAWSESNLKSPTILLNRLVANTTRAGRDRASGLLISNQNPFPPPGSSLPARHEVASSSRELDSRSRPYSPSPEGGPQ